MRITLQHIGKNAADLRFFIRADERHAGGITVHSIKGDTFSYGVAVAETLRRRGVARAALMLLFSRMKQKGFQKVFVQIKADNAASLALHASLGFSETKRENDVVEMEKSI